MNSRPVQGHATFERGVGDGFDAWVAQVWVHPADRRDHILAGPQNRHDLFIIGDQRAVHDTVGVEVQDRVDAGGGGDTERGNSDDLTYVYAILGLAVYPASGQLELRGTQHALDGGLADTTGCPLDDTKLHVWHSMTD